MKTDSTNVQMGDEFLVRTGGYYKNELNIITGNESYLDKSATYFVVKVIAVKEVKTILEDKK